MIYTFELAPFYESSSIKPALTQGALVTHGKNQFLIDRWQKFRDDEWQHCFVFVPLPGTLIKPFGKKPSEVMDLIKNKTIVIDLWPQLPQPNTKPS